MKETRAHTMAGALALALTLSACAATPRPVKIDRPDPPPEASEHPPGIWSDRYISPSAYAHYIEALIHWDQNRLDKALAHVDLALAFDPDSAYLRAIMAEIHIDLGELDDARHALDVAFSIDPDSTDALLAQARIAEGEGDWEAATASVERALSIDPDRFEGYRALSRYSLAQSDTRRAREVLAMLVERRPDDVQALLLLGDLASKQDHLDEAATHFEAVVELRPASAAGYLGLGAVMVAKGDRAEALSLFRRCSQRVRSGETGCWIERLVLDSGEAQAAAEAMAVDVDAAAEVAEALLALPESGVLAAFVEACERRLPERAELHYYLGKQHERAGRSEAAATAFGRVPKESRYFVSARSHQAGLLSALGQHGAAFAAMRGALSVRPDMAELHLLLATLHEQAGRQAQGLRVLEKAARSLPESVEIHFQLGEAAWRLQRQSQSQAALERAEKLSGGNDPRVLHRLGAILVEQGRELERAESLLRRAVELSEAPVDAERLGALGWVLLRREKYTEALAYLERAAKDSPDRAAILLRLGDARRADGQLEGALDAWRRALDKTQDRALRALLRRRIGALKPQAPE